MKRRFMKKNHPGRRVHPYYTHASTVDKSTLQITATMGGRSPLPPRHPSLRPTHRRRWTRRHASARRAPPPVNHPPVDAVTEPAPSPSPRTRAASCLTDPVELTARTSRAPTAESSCCAAQGDDAPRLPVGRVHVRERRGARGQRLCPLRAHVTGAKRNADGGCIGTAARASRRGVQPAAVNAAKAGRLMARVKVKDGEAEGEGRLGTPQTGWVLVWTYRVGVSEH